MDRIQEALQLAVEERWVGAQARGAQARREPPRRDPVEVEARLRLSADKPSWLAHALPPPEPGEAQKKPHPTPLGCARPAEPRLIAADLENPQREAYCLLHSAISRQLAVTEGRFLGLTSPRSGRGKTLTAMNLAVSLAREAGNKALLVDLNLRRPKISHFFDRIPTAGVEGCLFGGVDLEEALFVTSIDGLQVLAARGGSQNAAQVLQSENLKLLLADIRARYCDFITIVDLPALNAPGDAQAFESLVDAILLVVEDEVTRETDLKLALADLDKSKLIGTVLNNSRSL